MFVYVPPRSRPQSVLREVILKPLGIEDESSGWSGAQEYLKGERFLAALATFDAGQVAPRQAPRGQSSAGRVCVVYHRGRQCILVRCFRASLVVFTQ